MEKTVLKETEAALYRNSSFLLTCLYCLILVIGQIILANTEVRSPLHDWTASVFSLAVPVSCFWIGGLLRTVFQNPGTWVKAILFALLPLMYIRLMIWPYASIFYRVTPGFLIMMLSLIIMGYLLLPVCKSIKDWGWLALFLFLASAFCFVGVVRVSDHFSLVNFTLRDSEWTILFTRMIKYIPLLMSLFFLMAFSFSETGQRIGGTKWLQWTTIILVVASGIYLYSTAFWSFFRVRFILFHPLTVYLVVVIVRITRRPALRSL